MKTTDFTQYLKSLFPLTTFYTGMINKATPKCIGVFAKGRVPASIAIGGIGSTSTATLPITLLIHWTESTTECETMANSIYETLEALDEFKIANKRVVLLDLLDSTPVDVDRDEANIVEMVIRLNIIYER